MRKLLWIVASVIVLLLGSLAAVLIVNDPVKPVPLASVGDPFKGVDFNDLPAVQTYPARDGARLGYRAYPGTGTQVVVLIHGSSDDGSGMHLLAKGLQKTGASIYAPSLRGHRHSGRSGDIDYRGQLDDDLSDFIAMLRGQHRDASLSLIGFSSGGGFVLRTIAGPNEKLFDRFVMISPALPPGAPTMRSGTGGWVSLALPRIIALSLLNKIGIERFNGLPIIAFATSPTAPNLTSVYSYRLTMNFAAPTDYSSALGRSKKPVALVAGEMDELLYADRFAAVLQPGRPDLRVVIVPKVNHAGMIVSPEGIAATLGAWQEMIAASPREAGSRNQ